MKRTLLTLILIFTPILACAQGWSTLAPKVLDSVVRLEAGNFTCTGFIIDEKRKYILTAAHCIPDKDTDVYVNGEKAAVVNMRRDDDVAVLLVANVDGPALVPAKTNAAVGDDVAMIGFGYAVKEPLFRTAIVSHDSLSLPGLDGKYIVLDAAVIPGQSGGPFVNAKGEVIGVVQRSNEVLSLGLPIQDIYKATRRYWSVSQP